MLIVFSFLGIGNQRTRTHLVWLLKFQLWLLMFTAGWLLVSSAVARIKIVIVCMQSFSFWRLLLNLFSLVLLFWSNISLELLRMYKNGKVIPRDDSLDYGANFAHMLGFDDPAMLELMRLYITIHRCVLVLMQMSSKENHSFSQLKSWSDSLSNIFTYLLQWPWRWKC